MRALRAEVPAPDPDGPPLFWSLDGGMASLVDALAAGLRTRGADLRLSSPADRLERSSSGGWRRRVRRHGRRGGRRGAGDAGAGHRCTSPPARRRGGRTAGRHRLRLRGARDLPRRRRRHPLDDARHRVPRAAAQPAQGTRTVGGHGVHLPRSEVAAPRTRRRGAAARLARADRRHPRRRVDRRGGRRAGLGGVARAHGRGRSARGGAGHTFRERLPAVPGPPPAAHGRGGVGAGSPRRCRRRRRGVPRRRDPRLHRQRAVRARALL